jgi:hypothetical protein
MLGWQKRIAVPKEWNQLKFNPRHSSFNNDPQPPPLGLVGLHYPTIPGLKIRQRPPEFGEAQFLEYTT